MGNNEKGKASPFEREVERRKDMALNYLKNKRGREAAEPILAEFRTAVEQKGFKGITKDMIPAVEKYGTIKDKAVLCVIGYFDMKKETDAPIFSRKGVDAIRSELRNEGLEAMKEYVKYLHLYDALNKFRNYFYRYRSNYISLALQSSVFINLYEWFSKVENIFDSVAGMIRTDKLEDFKQEYIKYSEFTGIYKWIWQLDELKDVDGTKTEKCLKLSEEVTKYTDEALSYYKGVVEGTEKWLKKEDALIFLPMEIREQLYDTAIQEVPERYKRSHIKKMRQDGQRVTAFDRRLAFFPEFDDLKADKDLIKFTERELDECIKKQEQGEE